MYFTFALLSYKIFLLMIPSCRSLDGETYNPQNNAQTIIDSKDRNETAALILSYFTFEQCQKINTEYSKLNNGVPLVADASQYVARNPDTTIQDFIFAKIYGQEFTKVVYLKSALEGQYIEGGENILLEILIIEDSNRQALINSYNHYSQKPFLDSIKQYQNTGYKCFLNKLCSTTREKSDTIAEQQEIDDAAKALIEEMKQNSNSDDNTEKLDSVLMNQPIETCGAIINKYAEFNNASLRDDVAKRFISVQLRFCYQSLIDFVLKQYLYMATCIHESIKDTDDRKATLILQIVGNSENGEVFQIDKEFKNAYQKSISDFLTENGKDQIVYQRLIDILARVPEPPPPPPDYSTFPVMTK